MNRRDYLKLSIAAGAALAINPRWAFASDSSLPLITRAVPSSGQMLPAVGLGSSATFSSMAGSGDTDALREVLQAMREHGGSVFDTAPSYGASEEVAGGLVQELGISDDVFWATKLNVVPRGGDEADEAEARAQVEASFERIGKSPIDLIQVHNVADMDTQLAVLKEYREEGRVRYIGATNTRPEAYGVLEEWMEKSRMDFIGIDYAIDNRQMEERILPLAQERGIAVLVYAPFGRTRLWERVRGQELPEWASEFDASSWGQFFLKFVLAHPAVTVATPATSQARHMIDNMGAARGRLPDEAMRQRMIEYVQAL